MIAPPAKSLRLALLSRLLVLAGLALSGRLFADLDSSARLQVRACDRGAGGASGAAAPPPLSVWDAVHFVRIAKCGYETDMLGAFFPALPAAMRAVQGAVAGERRRAGGGSGRAGGSERGPHPPTPCFCPCLCIRPWQGPRAGLPVPSFAPSAVSRLLCGLVAQSHRQSAPALAPHQGSLSGSACTRCRRPGAAAGSGGCLAGAAAGGGRAGGQPGRLLRCGCPAPPVSGRAGGAGACSLQRPCASPALGRHPCLQGKASRPAAVTGPARPCHARACRLSLRTLRDRRLADLALLLFCANPASVFHSAAYTEPLYAAASFFGLWLLPDRPAAAVATFVAASAARSNGEAQRGRQ